MCIYNLAVGVYLSLNDNIIPNHGYVVISDIGSTDDTALICHTNHPATITDIGGSTNSGGDWIAPNGMTVGFGHISGFIRRRGPMMVRLLRNTATGTPSKGIYHCLVEDDTLTEQTVYVGLYRSGGGIMSTCVHTCAAQDISLYLIVWHSLWTLKPVTLDLHSPSPVSPLVDLLPLSLGPETLTLSLKELRLC